MGPTLVTEVSQLVQGHLWAVGFIALGSAAATLLGVRLFLLRPIVVNPQDARLAIYTLGLLANRGVETERIHNELRVLTRSDVLSFLAERALP
jgi:hypothetical protein